MDSVSRSRSPFAKALQRADAVDRRLSARAARAAQSPASQRKPPLKKRLKKAASSAAAAAAVAGALIASEVLPPPEAAMPPVTAPTAVTMQVEPAAAYNAEEDVRRRSARRNAGWVGRLLSAAKLLLVGLLSLAFRALTLLLTGFLTLLTGGMGAGIFGFLGAFLFMFVLLLLVMLWLFSLLYPDKKLSAFFTKRNLLLTALTALLITALSRLLPLVIGRKAGAVAALVEGLLTLLGALALPFVLFVRRGERAPLLRRVLSDKGLRRPLLLLLAGGLAASLARALFVLAGSWAQGLLLFLLAGGAALFALRCLRYKYARNFSQTYP